MKLTAIFLITLCFFTSVKSQVNTHDSLALVDFYDSTGGVNWTNHTNWLTLAPVNSWFGITVNGGRIIGIDLTTDSIKGNNLCGVIPSSIGNLDGLLFLRLGNNKLIGAIPTTLFNFTNLTELSLNNNQLTNTIPYSLGSLTNLTKLSLAGNQLVGSIPSSIGNLTNLTYLNFGFNLLTDSIPPSLGNLINLIHLDLFGNHLTGSIPVSIGNLANLTYLAFGDNQIRDSIPSSFGNLTHLLELDLGGNQLIGSIPTSLGNLTNLYRLNLGYNQLSGSIPTSIGNLTNLNFLYLNDNALSDSIPPSFVNLNKLFELNIRDNQISGSIPAFFSNFFRLNELILNNNKLIGSVPTSLSSTLSQLNLSSNQLSGSIPNSIVSMNNLQTLGFSNNFLTGTIPNSVGNILNLTNLSLASNQLTGAIPSSLGNLRNLTTVRLENNKFSFAGMDNIATLANGFDSIVTGTDSFLVFKKNIYYAPQATVPLINNNNILSISVGGIPANNSFRWYKDNVLMVTKVGDSTYLPPNNGHYSVVVTNAIDTQLILSSDTILITTLPINAVILQVKEDHENVSLQWHTINEINTASFIIQQSENGISFTNIGTKNAFGSSDNDYDFPINKPQNRMQYYRLQVIDKDGGKYYSNVTIIESLNVNSGIFLSPNPAKDMVIIHGIHISKVNITDNLGKIVLKKRIGEATNPNLSVSGLAAGIYHIKVITTDKQEKTLKLIIEN